MSRHKREKQRGSDQPEIDRRERLRTAAKLLAAGALRLLSEERESGGCEQEAQPMPDDD